MCLQIIYSQYIYKEDLVLDNLQCLIYHKTKPKQTGALGNLEYPFIAIVPMPTLTLKYYGLALSLSCGGLKVGERASTSAVINQ